ncbi:MAG: hypothetical protein AAF495_18255 [Pseudomonadota bacterium]
MTRPLIRVLLCLTILAVPLAASGQATFQVKRYGDLGPLLAYEIEGVSLATPLDAVPEILSAQGWQPLEGQPPKHLMFLKGETQAPERLFAAPGEDAFSLFVADLSDRKIVRLMRLRDPTLIEPGQPLQEGALRDTMDVPVVRGLKEVICAGIEEARMKKIICRPDTAERVALGTGYNPVRLRSSQGLAQIKAYASDKTGTVELVLYK